MGGNFEPGAALARATAAGGHSRWRRGVPVNYDLGDQK
jgi:hypothetical protein